MNSDLRSRNIFGIPEELIPAEGLPVASKSQIVNALKLGEIGRIEGVSIIEKTDSASGVSSL